MKFYVYLLYFQCIQYFNIENYNRKFVLFLIELYFLIVKSKFMYLYERNFNLKHFRDFFTDILQIYESKQENFKNVEIRGDSTILISIQMPLTAETSKA